MTESLEATDRIGSEGATEPRITLEYMTSQISIVHYIGGDAVRRHAAWTDTMDKAVPARLDIVTICMMVLKSGFVVLGMSAPMSAGNYDPVKGRLFAYEQCIRQLWVNFAFAAKQGKASP